MNTELEKKFLRIQILKKLIELSEQTKKCNPEEYDEEWKEKHIQYLQEQVDTLKEIDEFVQKNQISNDDQEWAEYMARRQAAMI